jgi:hypothetical protein
MIRRRMEVVANSRSRLQLSGVSHKIIRVAQENRILFSPRVISIPLTIITIIINIIIIIINIIIIVAVINIIIMIIVITMNLLSIIFLLLFSISSIKSIFLINRF